MKKENRILKENDVKHIETLLSKGLKLEEIAEIIGTSRTSVRRVKDGEHCLQRKREEKAVEEIPVTSEVKEVTLQDVVKNQEIIISLLKQYLAEWRMN